MSNIDNNGRLQCITIMIDITTDKIWISDNNNGYIIYIYTWTASKLITTNMLWMDNGKAEVRSEFQNWTIP